MSNKSFDSYKGIYFYTGGLIDVIVSCELDFTYEGSGEPVKKTPTQLQESL